MATANAAAMVDPRLLNWVGYELDISSLAQLRHELPLPTVVLAERDALRAAGSDRRVLAALGRDFAAQLGGAA